MKLIIPPEFRLARPEDAKRYVRGSGDGEGTVAVKGRAWFPYAAPVLPEKNEKNCVFFKKMKPFVPNILKRNCKFGLACLV